MWSCGRCGCRNIAQSLEYCPQCFVVRVRDGAVAVSDSEVLASDEGHAKGIAKSDTSSPAPIPPVKEVAAHGNGIRPAGNAEGAG
jgi:hypothetical protein